MTTLDDRDWLDLRQAILNILHKTEGDAEFMDKHLDPKKNGPCNIDIAAPRCAKRVKQLEAHINKHYISRAKLDEAFLKTRMDWDIEFGDTADQMLDDLRNNLGIGERNEFTKMQ